MFESYRSKLIASFSFFFVLSVLLTSVCLIYNKKVRNLDQITIEVERLYSLILMDTKIIEEFLSYAPSSKEFHSKKNSPSLEYHHNLHKEIFKDLRELLKDLETQMHFVSKPIKKLPTLLIDNDVRIQTMKNLLLERGYRQYGIEGVMRSNIHKLERIPGFELAGVLSLRRREKDYIIRSEDRYINLLLMESAEMREKLDKNPTLTASNKKIARYHLDTYVEQFKKLVELDRKMGIRNHSNLRAEIDLTHIHIQSLIEESIGEIQNIKSDNLQNFKLILGLTIGILLILGVFVTYYFSELLTKNIAWLSKDISCFIERDFVEDESEAKPQIGNDEIGRLTDSFFLLKEKISLYIKALKAEKEAADRANQSKSLFLANMSHEIRTPMNGVLGIAQLLEQTPVDGTQKNYLDLLKLSGQKLLGIINDILDFSKIEANMLEIEKNNLDIGMEISQVILLQEHDAINKGIEIRNEIPPSLPKMVQGDSIRINQIFSNLISNAIKFTENGFVALRAQVIKETKDTYHLEFEVEDTGVGISEEAQKKLFIAFSQADESTTRKFGGTGLGLAITKRLVNLMGGKISLKSQPGLGTSFFVEIPFEKINEPDRPNHKIEDFSKVFRGKKVLLVEDNKVNQKVAGLMLKKLGLEYEICENGKEAVKEVRRNSYDFVLMDIQMPIMDGYQATNAIRQLQQNNIIEHFPIIALTANATKDDKNKAQAAGMDNFLTKPLLIQKLKEILIQYLKIEIQPI